MRCVLLGLALSLAACGEEQPDTITRQERPDTSVEARRRAASAQRKFLELGETHKLGAAGEMAWKRAEDARTNKRFDAATESYDIAAKSYVGATASVQQSQAARVERAYLAAIKVQAVTLASRTQLDTLRLEVMQRVATADDRERELYATVKLVQGPHGGTWRAPERTTRPSPCGQSVPSMPRLRRRKAREGRTGSWDPIGVWGADGGRIYSTALMTLALLPTSR